MEKIAVKVQPYLPILKWKQAEFKSILFLEEGEKKNITPLFQIVPKETQDRDNPGQYIPISRDFILKDALEKIRKNFGAMKVYLDPGLVYSSEEKKEICDRICSPTTLFDNKIVPVLTFEDLKKISPDTSLNKFLSNQGVCLRIYKNELNDEFWTKIDQLLEKFGLKRTLVDIIFDFQNTNFDYKEQFLSQIKKDKDIDQWRSFYFASGAFRENLSGLKPGNHEDSRLDWLLWLSLIKDQKLLRKPGFCDYTIQFPIYTPSIRSPNTSFSVRYALEEKWLLLKGQARNAKNNAGTKQYYAHAKILTSMGLINQGNSCFGNRYIEKVSHNPEGEGNCTTWLEVGINRHISLTLDQISKLSSTIYP